MDILFFLLSFLCFITLIIGIISPKLVIRWGNTENRTRKNVLKFYGLGMLLSFLIFLLIIIYIDTPSSLDQATDSYNLEESITKEKSDKEGSRIESATIEEKQNIDSNTKVEKDKDDKKDFKEIEQLINNEDYIKADEHINSFLEDHNKSKYIKKVKKLKTKITPEVERLKEEKSAYKEIELLIKNEKYMEAEEHIITFLKEYDHSQYLGEIKKLQLDVNLKIEKLIKELEEKEAYEKKLQNKKIQALLNKGVNEKVAIEIFDIFEKYNLPIWSGEEDIIMEDDAIIEESNEKDYLLAYIANDGGFSVTHVMHILEGNLVEIKDSNMEIVYDKNGLNEEYLFYKDIDLSGLISHSKDLVKQVLKSPSTAKFPGSWLNPYDGWGISKEKNIISLSSYVDSQNSFGATIRSKFILKYEKNESKYLPLYFKFDGKVLTNKL